MWPNPQETADLVTFTEEIFNGKLNFLYSGTYMVMGLGTLKFVWLAIRTTLTDGDREKYRFVNDGFRISPPPPIPPCKHKGGRSSFSF